MKKIPIAVAAVVFFLTMMEAAQEKRIPFPIGGVRVMPGEVASFSLPVPAGVDAGTEIPITVIHGQKPGKVLALVAGLHGYEYPPVLALYRLKQAVDPKNLEGTLILVHIANVPGFQRRMIYYNPLDWKNLNRVFPGDAGGTSSQRIARILTREVVERCDALIDMHCGDGNEALIPYTYWIITDDRALDEQSRQMAVAFGLKYIIIDRGRPKNRDDAKYLGNTALLLGKPSITTESGLLGRTDEEAIKRNLDGVQNVMGLFKMIPSGWQNLGEPVWIDRYEVVNSSATGLFHPLTGMGYHAAEGELVGYVTDYTGRRIADLRAPFSGIILYILGTPPANAGEPLYEIGHIKD